MRCATSGSRRTWVSTRVPSHEMALTRTAYVCYPSSSMSKTEATYSQVGVLMRHSPSPVRHKLPTAVFGNRFATNALSLSGDVKTPMISKSSYW